MNLGVTIFFTDRSMGPAAAAREVEARGFHSLYVPEHTHIPTSRVTPSPTGEAELPDEYKRTLDPFIALAAAAAVTSRIKLGTGVSLIAQHDPIVLAKEIATLDLISDGRVVLGIGFGWNRDEMESHGVDFRTRRARVRETVLAMQALWNGDTGGFEGEHVRIPESWSWPKPVQRPGPPILIGGGAGPKLFSHIAEYGDGWIPVGGGGVAAAVPALHRAVEEAGRDPATLQLVILGTIPTAEKLERFASMGVTEVVARVPAGPAEEILPALDAYAQLI
jgi:probable F420-dependent oxidoreductase